MFWDRVEKSDGCWHWKGMPNSKYGRMKTGGETIKAHRLSFIIHGGILTPEKPCVCHTCDNPMCVNPSHLWAGSCAENLADMKRKGRSTKGKSFGEARKGSKNGNAKLDESDVVAIKLLIGCGDSGISIARRYGVTKRIIYLIKDGKLWRHVK